MALYGQQEDVCETMQIYTEFIKNMYISISCLMDLKLEIHLNTLRRE